LPSGSAVAKTGIAVNRTWKDKMSGEQKQETMFMDIVIYGKSAEIANQYMLKGKKVLVEGRLVLEQWVDQSGQKRSRHVIIVESFQFLDSKKEGDKPSEPTGDIEYDEGDKPSEPTGDIEYDLENPPIDIDDDCIPFNSG
jgi:single-strand DNA-binding protein